MHHAPMPSSKVPQFQKAICPLEVTICQAKARHEFFRKVLRVSDIV